MDIKVGRQAIAQATQKLSNWGRWGKHDQIGTLNQVTPEDIVKAASLIRSGRALFRSTHPASITADHSYNRQACSADVSILSIR